MRLVKIWALAQLLSVLPVQAFASPIFFDFTYSDGQSSDSMFHFDSQGIGLTAWGMQDDGGTLSAATVYQDQFGLGLLSNSSDNSEIDARGPDEQLLLQFDTNVQLVEIGFTQVGSNDEFILSGEMFNDIAADIPGGSGTDDLGFGSYAFSPDQTMGSLFSIRPFDGYSEFTIASLTVMTVPSPETLWLLVLGFSVLLVTQKRTYHQYNS
jgi:hypothetical protein